MACPSTGNQSFPIGLEPGVVPTQDLYTSLKSPVSVEFTWSSRTNAPIFLNQAKGLLDEGGSNQSSARFQAMDYSLLSAQITNATHNSWIVNADAKNANRLDIVCIFKSRLADTQFPYIFVVIPIISMDSASPESNYLLALAGLCGDRKIHSLEDALPPPDRRDYVNYITCLNPNGENALVLFFMNGRYASLKTTNGIYEMSGRGPTTPWPSLEVPTNITLSTPSTLNSDKFNKSVRVGTLISREVRGGQFRIDDTNAYTCVVMDPDKDIKDGKFLIDTNTGNPLPLNSVLAERESVRRFEIPISGLSPGVLEQAVAIFLGSLLGLVLLFMIIYFYLDWKNGGGAAPSWFSKISGIVLSAGLFGFIGFLIGIFIHPR